MLQLEHEKPVSRLPVSKFLFSYVILAVVDTGPNGLILGNIGARQKAMFFLSIKFFFLRIHRENKPFFVIFQTE